MTAKSSIATQRRRRNVTPTDTTPEVQDADFLAVPRLNIYQKLVAVRKSVDVLYKENKGYAYSYVSSSQVLTSLRVAMNEHGLLIVPSVTSKNILQFADKRDGNQFLTDLGMRYELIDSDNPAERIVLEWAGQGVDSAEKGVGKAMTYAEKYMLLKLFNIPTDKDDPDAHQRREAAEQPATKATSPAAPKPAAEMPRNPYRGLVRRVYVGGSSQAGAASPWTRWAVETDACTFNTFEAATADALTVACETGSLVELVWKLNKYKGGDIVDFAVLSSQSEDMVDILEKTRRELEHCHTKDDFTRLRERLEALRAWENPLIKNLVTETFSRVIGAAARRAA